MSQEIFGPALPVITWRDLDEALDIVRSIKHPLACYIFSNSRRFPAAHPGCSALRRGHHQRRGHSREQQSDGLSAACRTPASAPTTARWASTQFTHYKSTMKKSTLIETGIRNPPFNETKMHLLKLVMPGK